MKRFLALLKPPKYNNPTCWWMLYNQWQHQFYLWGWQSYAKYASKSREVKS